MGEVFLNSRHIGILVGRNTGLFGVVSWLARVGCVIGLGWLGGSPGMKRIVTLLLIAAPCFGQQSQQAIRNLNALVGKRVIVQRATVLCSPGTFNMVQGYVGKEGNVISVKPSNIRRLSDAALSRLRPDARAMMEEQYNAATILLQFDDGTKLDTCYAINPGRIAAYLELAPGQVLQPEAQAANPSVPAPSSPLNTEVPKNLLPDETVKQALAGAGRGRWARLEDMGLGAAQGNQVPSITLYMPEAVLAIQAESAKSQFKKYEPTEDERRNALMIVAEGYAGKTITEGCTSITRVVLLSDRSGGIVTEAYQSQPLSETWANNFGATNHCQALQAKFSLDDVHRVRAAAPNGEFLVAVFSGSVNTKMYKVKKKHQSKLGLD